MCACFTTDPTRTLLSTQLRDNLSLMYPHNDSCSSGIIHDVSMGIANKKLFFLKSVFEEEERISKSNSSQNEMHCGGQCTMSWALHVATNTDQINLKSAYKIHLPTKIHSTALLTTFHHCRDIRLSKPKHLLHLC